MMASSGLEVNELMEMAKGVSPTTVAAPQVPLDAPKIPLAPRTQADIPTNTYKTLVFEGNDRFFLKNPQINRNIFEDLKYSRSQIPFALFAIFAILKLYNPQAPTPRG